ncbi:MAG TPA: hypothetical protein VF529_18505 [Solirubrobacteraceae bacterium]|jgi:hypothetical protein
MTPLDLGRRRDVGALIETAFSAWFRHFPVFFTLALIVVAPLRVLIDGVWAGTLDEFDETGTPAPFLVSTLTSWIFMPALVTAMHVVAVQDLAHGRSPTIRRSLGVAVRLFPAVVLVLVLYGLGVVGGMVLLVIPGIWLATRWYFGLQAAVVEGARGAAALRRSAQLVDGTWWRVFGITLLVSILTSLFALPLVLAGVLLHSAGIDDGVLVAVCQVLWDTLGISFTALTTTLLYFDLRVRRGAAETAEQRFAIAPERPHAV